MFRNRSLDSMDWSTLWASCIAVGYDLQEYVCSLPSYPRLDCSENSTLLLLCACQLFLFIVAVYLYPLSHEVVRVWEERVLILCQRREGKEIEAFWERRGRDWPLNWVALVFVGGHCAHLWFCWGENWMLDLATMASSEIKKHWWVSNRKVIYISLCFSYAS